MEKTTQVQAPIPKPITNRDPSSETILEHASFQLANMQQLVVARNSKVNTCKWFNNCIPHTTKPHIGLAPNQLANQLPFSGAQLPCLSGRTHWVGPVLISHLPEDQWSFVIGHVSVVGGVLTGVCHHPDVLYSETQGRIWAAFDPFFRLVPHHLHLAVVVT